MKRQSIKSIIICIVIVIGLLVSGFLLVQELSVVPITYASDIDMTMNFSNKNTTIQNITEDNSIYSNFFSGANKKIEPKKQTEPTNTPEIVQSEPIKTEPIKVSVKKVIAPTPRATTGRKCPAEGNDHASSSNKKKNHMDEDCCADYDEWPKPGCAYSAKDFQLMLSGPTSGHVKHK